ncbi:MAG TPA: hypothetical protein DDW84_08115 [Phycisphaerales bacterium]|nr:hypothetical protein [Phycisphaerales bacterium]HBR19809.1 hypothetical protein [Phycisphaerales bacterium]
MPRPFSRAVRQPQKDSIGPDPQSYGAIEELCSAGIKVPDDVRVTGFDNEEFSDKLAIPLTTVETDSFQVGRLGAKLLLARTSGENKPASVHICRCRHQRLPASFAMRFPAMKLFHPGKELSAEPCCRRQPCGSR